MSKWSERWEVAWHVTILMNPCLDYLCCELTSTTSGCNPLYWGMAWQGDSAKCAMRPVSISCRLLSVLSCACRWEEGHIEEWSAISYPNELHMYVTSEFQRIKQRQANLLGIKDGIRSKL